MLRAQQLEAFQKASSIADQFASGSSQLLQPVCTKPATGRSRVALSVTANTKGKDAPARVVGDSVVAFNVEVLPDVDFQFGAGMMVNTLFGRGKVFGVSNGIITQQEGDPVLYRPMFFGHYRMLGTRWLFATIGSAVSTSTTLTDVFVGLTGRFGTGGVGIALGLGLGLSQQNVGLSQGQVGQALPAGVSDITKITTSQKLSGVGITLSILGF
jgi:hypothetical protein